MQSGEIYIQNQSFNLEKFESRLSRHFKIETVTGSEIPAKYFDSFDWRLYENGQTLQQKNDKFHLLSLNDGSIIHTVSLTQLQAVRFWWDFPDGSLKNVLKSILDVRALLPALQVTSASQNLVLRNTDEKIVLQIELESLRLATGSQESVQIHLIKLQPVKGYPAEFKQVQVILADFASMINSFGEIYTSLLQTTGKKPGAYSSKMTVELTPEMTADQAMRKILNFLLQVIRQNQAGILNDWDTEFLHDFRVAVRRTRAALTQIKGIFPEEKLAAFKQGFVKLGKGTNRLRDLDVYLLKKQTYYTMLPEYLQSGLNPLFKQLEQERNQAFQSVKQLLSADEVQQLLEDWEHFLNPSSLPETETGSMAALPAQKVARQFIDKRFRKVLKISQKIHKDTPDSEIHRLRIQCKKLRYLLEFFSSLFPADKIKILIKHLKKLQGRLGDFNDLSVQQKQLKHDLNVTKSDAMRTHHTHSAIGALIGILHQKQHDMRSELQQLFDEFSQPPILKIHKKLFR